MAKKKKLLKKLAKAALIGGALYGGSKLLKNRGLKKSIAGMDDAGINVKHFQPDDYNYKPKFRYGPGNIDPGPTLAAKGGRIGAKSGGRVKSMGIAKRGGGAVKR